MYLLVSDILSLLEIANHCEMHVLAHHTLWSLNLKSGLTQNRTNPSWSSCMKVRCWPKEEIHGVIGRPITDKIILSLWGLQLALPLLERNLQNKKKYMVACCFTIMKITVRNILPDIGDLVYLIQDAERPGSKELQYRFLHIKTKCFNSSSSMNKSGFQIKIDLTWTSSFILQLLCTNKQSVLV